MKPTNVLLTGICVVLGGFFWIAHVMSSGSSPAAIGTGDTVMTTNSQLNAAIATNHPVLVEFYADWCGPCRAVGPSVEKLAEELRGKAEVVRFNIDQNRELSKQFRVEGVPCFIAIRHGHETARQLGGIPPSMMRSMIGL
jgi:thioredoxin 1